MIRRVGFVALFIGLFSHIPFAQPQGTVNQDIILLDPLVITAERWETPYSEVPDRVTIIHQLNIEKAPVRDAAEALDLAVGVIMDRTGGAGSITFPSIQGASYYQTTVLVNGIPLNDLANGLGNLGQIPSEFIDRIEVVHGAGGVEWGSALGGVINIITKRPGAKVKNSVSAGIGEYSTGFGALNAQLKSKNAAFAINLEAREGAGSEDDMRSMSRQNLLTTADVNLGNDLLLSLLGYTFQGEIGSGKFVGDLAGYWENYIYRTSGIGATIDSFLGPGEIKITSYFQNQVQITRPNMVDTGRLDDVRLEDKILGGSAIWNADIEVVVITIGTDIRNGETKSSSLLEDSYSLDTFGSFINLKKKISDLIFQGGIRYSDEDLYGDFTGYNVGAMYNLKPMQIRATVSRGYSTPPLSFRYLEITDFFAPNPDLTFEEVLAYQLGIGGPVGYGFKIDLNLFSADVTNAISVDQTDEGLSIFRNFQEFERRGLDAQVEWSPGKYGFSVLVNTLQQEITDKATDEIVKDQVRAAYAFGIGYTVPKWSALLSGTYRDWNSSERADAIDKEWLLNAKTRYNFRLEEGSQIRASLSIFNITNVELATNSLQPRTPPRQIEFALQYLFQ